ncbi:MAG: transcription elongation factor GreA [Candidatus Promineifilaceae bacterium]|nr:transcription elongation factor GreA [Candidatus Promineifilaceae bacterium]
MTSQKSAMYITQEGLEKMKEELEELKNVRRPQLSERLREAIAQGDLSENADYHAAKEEQGFLEGRIRELEDAVRRAKIIKESGPSDVVRVGSTVTIVDEEYGDEERYRIVGGHEAAPTDGLISNESPIGEALLGAKVGQTVSVRTPAGQVQFRVKTIE